MLDLGNARLALCFSVLAVGCATSPSTAADNADPGRLQGVFVPPSVYIDDHDLVVDATNLEAKRLALIDYLWGDHGFPTALPAVQRGIPSPLSGLTNLRRVDELRIAMDGGESNVTQHFIAARSNGRLVVVSLGHMCTFADEDDVDPTSDEGYGLYRTVDALLKDGYSVLGAYMPHMRPGECADIDHNELLAKPVTYGHAAKWFMEPVAVSLNYLSANATSDGFPRYRDFSMMGLSGGGWTTTLYAAIDPRVKTSIPIAGSVPIYLRSGDSLGDGEQMLPELYAIAGYPDLYALGAAGIDRRQVQVLNRHDGCCFGESPVEYDAAAHGPWDQAMRSVEKQIDSRLVAMEKVGGAFRLEIDETPWHHTISWTSLVGTVLAELNAGTRRVATDSTQSVYLREGGTMWSWGTSGWTDTALPMAGTPAVLSSDRGTELFYRSPANELMHAYREGGAWKERALGVTLTSDPVVVRSPVANVLTVAGIGDTYRPVVLTVPLDGENATSQIVQATDQTTSVINVDESPRVVGTPALVQDASTLRIYARGLDRRLHVFEARSASAAFTHADLGGTLLDFPAAVQTSDGVMRAYVNDAETKRMREVSLGPDKEWVWSDVVVTSAAPPGSAPGAAKPSALGGTPAVTMDGAVLRVHSRTQSGSLQVLEYDDAAGDWSSTQVRLRMNSSPLAVGDQVFGTAFGRVLWKYDGTEVKRLGRPR
jgi:hypothetical protein